VHVCWAGLIAAQYTRDGEGIACPTSDGGLHVRTRRGEVVLVQFPPDRLAFQIGEVMQVCKVVVSISSAFARSQVVK
jgi:hypothetical protein